MKKIYIYAYNRTNLGDDIFVKILCNRYPNTKFVMQCQIKHSKAFSQIVNLKVVAKVPYIDTVLKKIGTNLSINRLMEEHHRKKTDGVVRIGGSIFMESFAGKTRYDELKAKYVKHGLPVFVIGANFGPYHSEEFIDFYKTLFRQLRDVCFRDQYSWNLFPNYPNIRVAPDVLFCYPAQQSTFATNKSVLVSVIDLTNRPGLSEYNKIYQGKIAELCVEFSSHNYRITLMSFCDAEGDKKAIDEVSEFVSRSGRDVLVEKYSYNGNIEEAITRIAGADCVIASRFHAMILGWVMNKRVFPIVYSKKADNVIDDIGYKGLKTRIEDINNVKAENIFEFLNDSKPINIEGQKTDASRHFHALDGFLNYQKGTCDL